MQPISSYKYFGLAAVLALFCGLIFILIRWPQGKHKTFSQHVAVYRHTILYYILLFSAVLPVLLLFFVNWFVPMFQLSPWFSILVIISSVFQYACTLIPEIGGWKTKIHLVLAGLSAICLVPALFLLSLSDFVSVWGKVMVIAGLLVMLGIVTILVVKRGRQISALLLQAGYFVAFFVPVLGVSYL